MIKGKCSCYENFTGVDCSIDLTSPATIFSSSFNNSMCDIRTENCSYFVLFSKNLIERQIMYSTLHTYDLTKSVNI